MGKGCTLLSLASESDPALVDELLIGQYSALAIRDQHSAALCQPGVAQLRNALIAASTSGRLCCSNF